MIAPLLAQKLVLLKVNLVMVEAMLVLVLVRLKVLLTAVRGLQALKASAVVLHTIVPAVQVVV